MTVLYFFVKNVSCVRNCASLFTTLSVSRSGLHNYCSIDQTNKVLYEIKFIKSNSQFDQSQLFRPYNN